MIVVVSEETGKISLVQNEEVITDLDGPELKKLLSENMPLSGKTPLGRRLFRKDTQSL
jgi:hypothetical protein